MKAEIITQHEFTDWRAVGYMDEDSDDPTSMYLYMVSRECAKREFSGRRVRKLGFLMVVELKETVDAGVLDVNYALKGLLKIVRRM